MPDKSDPRRLLFPGLAGRVMVDTWRGKVRVRAWPKKRGRSSSEAVQRQNDWFRAATRLAARAPGSQMASAISITRNSGLYPKDLLMRMMAGNIGPIPTGDGRVMTKATKRIEPVSFQGARLQIATPLALAAGGFVILTWPLPVWDPLGLWSAGAPTRLTVPNNVSMVQVLGSLRVSSPGFNHLHMVILKNGVAGPRADTGDSTVVGGPVVAGPEPVVSGDYFELGIVSHIAATLEANAGSFFTIELKTAT